MFDLIAAAALLISAITGWVRGAAKELTTVLAFVGAAVISIFALRITGPIARTLVHGPDWLAVAVAVLVGFLTAYIALRIVGGMLAKRIHETETLGTLDRIVGAAFGLVRAFVLLGVFNLVFNAATPADRAPKWVTGAALYPLTSVSARMLRVFAPQGQSLAGRLAPALKRATEDDDSSDRNPPQKGYENRDRESVDRLVEKSR